MNEGSTNHYPLTTIHNKESLAQGFAQFWSKYPKHKSKGDAEKAWKSLSPSEPLIASILQAVERATTSEQWQRNDGQFIPYPATWLRAKGWEDDVAQSSGVRVDA